MKTFNVEDKKTTLMVLQAILWLGVTVMGWTGAWFLGLYLGFAIILIYLVLGSAKDGKVSVEFFKYPILAYILLWVVNFALSYYWGKVAIPDFTIMGLDPSFACTVFLYWIGASLILVGGFKTRREYWLSEEEWDEFLNELDELQESN